jgi:hypothetical protein
MHASESDFYTATLLMKASEFEFYTTEKKKKKESEQHDLSKG